MEEKIKKLKELLSDILKEAKNLRELKTLYNVKPKFSVGQKVYIIDENKVPSWYKMPIRVKTLEEGLEEIEIEVVRIGMRRHLDFSGCADEDGDKIGISYQYGWNERCLSESRVWETKDAFLKENRAKYNTEKRKWNAELKKEKDEKKERLKRELKEL